MELDKPKEEEINPELFNNFMNETNRYLGL